MKMKLTRPLSILKFTILLGLLLQCTEGRRTHGYEDIKPYHKKIFGDLAITQMSDDYINSCKYLCDPIEDEHWNCEAKFPFLTQPECKLCQMKKNINFSTANNEAMRLWKNSFDKFKTENRNWESHLVSFCNICVVPRKERGGTCIPGNNILKALDSSSYCTHFCKPTPESQNMSCQFLDGARSEQCKECVPIVVREREQEFEKLKSSDSNIIRENSQENFCKTCFQGSKNKCEIGVKSTSNSPNPSTSLPQTKATRPSPKNKPVLNCQNSCEVKQSTSLLCKISSNMKICQRCDIKWDTDYENCFDCTKCFGTGPGSNCQAIKLMSSSIFDNFDPDGQCSKYCQKGTRESQCSFKNAVNEQDQIQFKKQNCHKCTVSVKENIDFDKLYFQFFTSFPGLFEGVKIPEYTPNLSISEYITNNQNFNLRARDIINNFCGSCGYSESNLSCKWDYSQAKKKRRIK